MTERSSADDLAIFGRNPAFASALHVGRPNVGDRAALRRRIDDLLDRRWLTNDGPYVREFERSVEALLGIRRCVAVCNATIGLEIAIKALGLTGEVIVPAFTFVATAHACQWHGITPVFCDVDRETHNLDPRQVEPLITPRTTGIIGVHLWGRPCDPPALQEIASRHGLSLVYDAAHAFVCSHQGRMIGNFGRCEVLSFHATKFLNTFEGGAIVTNDDGLADRVSAMRDYGFAGPDDVVCVGTNAKMGEIAAAMGLTGLESLEAIVGANRRNYQQYRRELAGVPGVRLLAYDEAERQNYQYVVLTVEEAVAGLGRDDLLAVLTAENVLARRYFHPGCHRLEPYRSLFPTVGQRLPVTEALGESVLVLPSGPAVEPDGVGLVCQIIRLAVAAGPRVRARLRARDDLSGDSGSRSGGPGDPADDPGRPR